MFAVVIWGNIINTLWVMTVNIQLYGNKKKKEKKQQPTNGEIRHFCNFADRQDVFPSLSFLVLRLLCKKPESETQFVTVFSLGRGPRCSSASLTCIGLWWNTWNVEQGLCAYLNCNDEYTNQNGSRVEARTPPPHTHTHTLCPDRLFLGW